MAIVAATEITRKNIPDRDGYVKRYTITSTVTDDADPTFKPIKGSCTDFPKVKADISQMTVKVKNQIQAEIDKRKAVAAEIAGEVSLLGNLEADNNAYLTKNLEA